VKIKMVIHRRRGKDAKWDGIWHDQAMSDSGPQMQPRFLTLTDVADTLNISAAQAYALVRNGDLPAIKIGGRGQWRVESHVLESYIAKMYMQTREFVDSHPFTKDDTSSAKD
jgi:excisionase family DNA binding protein